jgi:Icc-related predicted phosphoesterase
MVSQMDFQINISIIHGDLTSRRHLLQIGSSKFRYVESSGGSG